MNRRFIAGAVCPRCGEMDRIVAFSKGGDQFRECVSCGFEEKLVVQVAAKELDTRVNRAVDEAQDAAVETQTIKIVKPD